MTAVHSAGSYTEPILISDEEDAAFVENELSRWTDSSNSSSNTPTYTPTYSSGHSALASSSKPTEALPLTSTGTVSVPPPPPPPPSSSPVAATLPSSGHKRKWTDIRESGSTSQLQPPPDHTGGSKKKKKQRKDRQRNAPTSAFPNGEPHHVQHDGLVHPMMMQDGTTATHQHVDFFPLPYYSQPPFDLPGFGFGYTWPIDPYQAVGNAYISPEDEYRPTDGPLWNPTERPSMLSALATPWYPSSYGSDSYAATESLGTSQIPERPPSPAPPHAEPSTQPQPSSSTYAAEQESTSDAPQPDLSTLFNQPFDASLSERLRQLEALSASLLALTGGSSSAPGTSAYAEQHPPLPMSPPLLPHPRHRPEAPPTRNLPERPVGAPVESSKRLMGVLEDKGNNGYFDLSAPNLDPPAPSAPIPPVVDFTLVMAQLPKKFRKVDFVTSWAKRYGTPVRVVVDAKSGKALVEWVGSHSADGAFASLRLRGDGKEHIRVYRYKGDKPPRTLRPSETSFPADKEIEEGEIEEGEVVETNLKFKKKKNKGKKKAPHLEERLAEPVPLVAAIHAHPRVPDVNVLASSAHVPEHSTSRREAAPVAVTIPSPRQPLIERFSEMPLLPTSREDAWEEEMELESEDEARKSQPSPPLVMSASTVGEPEEEDMDLEDDVDDVGAEDADAEDEDMEMSSVADGSRPPSPALEITTASPAPQPPVVTAALDESFIQELAPPVPELPLTTEKKEASIKEIRRQKLEDAIARTKAELAMRALAYSSRTSLSSNGSSESPEPMTPLDSPSLDHARVVTDAKESAVDGSVVIKTESTTVNFDDLASSFISETIHAAAVLPHSSPFPTSTPTVSMEQPRNTPSSTVAAPIPISIQTSAPFAPITVTVPLTEEQKQIKQKRWLELVSTSKSLFGKIAAAKTKEEKDLLMRLLKAKTKAADEVKREIDSGVVVVKVNKPAPVVSSSMPSPTSVTTSATPTPVPSSRRSSATPTPASTPTPSTVAPQKRKPSPTVPFRWPETAREMIIIISDDEAD